MLHGQGVRCLASLHCFIIKYQSIRWREYTIIHYSIFSFKALISGRSRGGPPLCLHQTEAWRAEKKIWGETRPPPPPLPQGLDDRAGSATAYSIGFNLGGSLDHLPRSATDWLPLQWTFPTQPRQVMWSWLKQSWSFVRVSLYIPVFLVRPRHKCLPSFCFQTHGQLPLHIKQAHVPQVYSRNHREGSMIFMVFL